MRDFFERADMCFDNSPYMSQWIDPPFVVNNNCHAKTESGTNYFDCHTTGYKVRVRVIDHYEMNVAGNYAWPIRLPSMYVKVTLDHVKDYFAIFPENKMKISFYMGNE